LVLVCTLLAAAAADFTSVPHKNCKSLFDVKSLSASECELIEVEHSDEKKKACRFMSGTKPTIKITFVPNESGVTDLHTSVRAKFGKSTLPYAMTDFETCKHGNIACPLEAGKEYNYSQDFHIDASYPKVKRAVPSELEHWPRRQEGHLRGLLR
ncbi:hypothetical protein PFISCL1PPCAC_3553, partial [Pristionchus fissidentatus]